jgi:hypothetical protein
MRGLEVRQLVDREDAAVGARHDAEVDDLLVGVRAPLGRGLDRVDVADQVGDRDVRRRELLAVALLARDPGDRGRIALLGESAASVLRDRREGVLAELASRDRRDLRVEEGDEHAEQARLRLAAQPEEQQVVPGQDRVVERGQHGPLVAVDAGEGALAALDGAAQIRAELVLHAAGRVAARLQLTEGLGFVLGNGFLSWT